MNETGLYPAAFEAKWQMLVSKQQIPPSDGVYGVRSTGIFCQFGCASRLPLKHNVTFFANIDAAAQAGFRACKRCKPDKS